MKKSLLAISSCLFLFCMSCNNKAGDDKMGGGKMSDQAEKNIAASHVVSDAFQSGDISKIDSVVASDFVDHTERGDMGRDSLKAMITAIVTLHGAIALLFHWPIRNLRFRVYAVAGVSHRHLV